MTQFFYNGTLITMWVFRSLGDLFLIQQPRISQGGAIAQKKINSIFDWVQLGPDALVSYTITLSPSGRRI